MLFFFRISCALGWNYRRKFCLTFIFLTRRVWWSRGGGGRVYNGSCVILNYKLQLVASSDIIIKTILWLVYVFLEIFCCVGVRWKRLAFVPLSLLFEFAVHLQAEFTLTYEREFHFETIYRIPSRPSKSQRTFFHHICCIPTMYYKRDGHRNNINLFSKIQLLVGQFRLRVSLTFEWGRKNRGFHGFELKEGHV